MNSLIKVFYSAEHMTIRVKYSWFILLINDWAKLNSNV